MATATTKQNVSKHKFEVAMKPLKKETGETKKALDKKFLVLGGLFLILHILQPSPFAFIFVLLNLYLSINEEKVKETVGTKYYWNVCECGRRRDDDAHKRVIKRLDKLEDKKELL